MNANRNEDTKIYSETINSDASEVCREVKIILNRLQVTSGIDSDQQFDIRVILSELLQNAIKHGNAMDNKKKILVDVRLQDNRRILSICVADQGQGFDVNHTISRKKRKVNVDDPLSMDESGRGLFIIQNLCDDIQFNRIGNAIIVKKRLASH